MIPRKFLEALKTIVERLREADLNWALTGGTSFALQGVPLTPHDIDIQTDREGAYEFERLFREFLTRKVKFRESQRLRSHFGAFRIGGLKVEVMGGLQKRLPDGSWEPPVDVPTHRCFLKVAGLRVPVLDLEYERQAYQKLGRAEKAALLAEWLKRA